MKVITSVGYPFSQEPSQEVSFMAGYQSFGKTFNGEFLYMELSTLLNSLEHAYNNGFELVFSPTSSAQSAVNVAAYYYDKGIQLVMPAGSNTYHANSYTGNIRSIVLCGSGKYNNQTGYKCEFFGIDPVANTANITNITQEGTVYNVSKVKRLSSTLFGIQLSGINDLTTIGITTHGIPITIADLSGSDISPLPSGTYYTHSITGDKTTLYITFSTSSGTLNSLQNASAGTCKFAFSTNYAFLQTDVYGYWNTNFGILIEGAAGLQYNPNGIHNVRSYINTDGYGDKFDIAFNIGTGTYTGGGTVRMDTQSNAHAFIAGVLAAVKDELGCTWWEARYRMRMTASNLGVFDTYDGYGIPDPEAAIEYAGEIPPDENLILGNIGNLTVQKQEDNARISITSVTNASSYIIYLDNEELTTLYSKDSLFYNHPLELKFKNETKFKFSYKAFNSNGETAMSTYKRITNYKFRKFIFK